VKLPIGCTLRLRLDSLPNDLDNEEPEQVLMVEISDLVVSFGRSEKTLESIISLISDLILPVIKPASEKYIFRMKFGASNPYFGLFVRRLRVSNQKLLSFRCEFAENVGYKPGRVDVSAEKLTLITSNVTSFQTLTKRYVTLSALDLTSN